MTSYILEDWQRENIDRKLAEESGPEPNTFDTAFPAVGADFWQAPGAPIRWMVNGWLQADRVGLLTGKGGGGKTKLAVMLAAGVATGRTAWLTNGPTLGIAGQGVVTFASWENTRDEIRRMLTDWPEAREGNLQQTLPALLGDRFRFRDLAGLGPLWAAEGKGLTDLGARLRADAAGSDLLILDPLTAAYSDSEIARANVRAFMADWGSWAGETRCTVLIVAHPSMANPDFSGSTDWHNAARSMWTLNLSEGDTKFEAIKVNAGPRPKPLRLDDWTWWRASPWDAADAKREEEVFETLRRLDQAMPKGKLAEAAPGNKAANMAAIERLYEIGRLTRKPKGTGYVYSLAE